MIKEAGDGLVVEERGWGGQFDGEFGVGGGAEGRVGRGAAREEKLGCVQNGERFGEGKALVEEETDGDEFGPRVAHGCVEEVGARRIEYQGRDGAVSGDELGRKGGAGPGSVGDDLLRWDGARGREVLKGGVDVSGHALLAGADAGSGRSRGSQTRRR